jgi:ribosomal-protein-alanine N-acetyltransferase
MKIRALDHCDLESVTELDHLCFPPGIAFPRDLFEQCILDDYCECFGIEADGGLAAFAVISFPGPRVVNIITIDVHPGYRGKGMADALMAEIFRIASINDVRRIVLQVSVDNRPAIALYEKHGFAIKAELQNYYSDGKHAFLMERPVESEQAE